MLDRTDEIGRLVEPGRVHRRVYTDPEIFELEMERLFGRAGCSSAMPARSPTRATTSRPNSVASR